MAQCKDCGQQTRILQSYCSPCSDKRKAEQQAAEATRKVAFEQEQRAERERLEGAKYAQALTNLETEHDRMENQIRFFGENWYANVGGTRLTLRFCGVHDLASRQTFLWTLCYRKGSEWDLLEYHRSIILLPNGERFVYEAEVRVETEVTQGFNYSVICNEIAHIPASEWLEEVSSAYHDKIRQDALRPVELRVGSYQFALPFEALRSAAVVIAKAQALN